MRDPEDQSGMGPSATKIELITVSPQHETFQSILERHIEIICNGMYAAKRNYKPKYFWLGEPGEWVFPIHERIETMWEQVAGFGLSSSEVAVRHVQEKGLAKVLRAANKDYQRLAGGGSSLFNVGWVIPRSSRRQHGFDDSSVHICIALPAESFGTLTLDDLLYGD